MKYFFHRSEKNISPTIIFDGIEVKRVTEHKHLGLILDPLLSFAAHFKEKVAKARKGIGLIKHLRSFLPTNALARRASSRLLRLYLSYSGTAEKSEH